MRQGHDSKPIHQTQGSDSAKQFQLLQHNTLSPEPFSCNIGAMSSISSLQFVKLDYFMYWSIMEEVIHSYGHGNDHSGNQFPS